MEKVHVALLGATGAVGRQMLRVMEERKFPVGKLTLLASERSAGTILTYAGKDIVVEPVDERKFAGVDIALFSPGGAVSKLYAPEAASRGAVVVDNSSAFRMDPQVPLVVPEVNPHAVKAHKGIISNPNCSTIQMVVALKPIYDAVGIRRVVVSTYQSVSGAGNKGMEELADHTRAWMEHRRVEPRHFPYPIAFNAIPQIDVFMENGYSKEEMKMILETQKIMEDNRIQISPTTVRIPVMIGHSEAVNIETERFLSAADAKAIWENAPGITVIDDLSALQYPTPIHAAGKDDVFVGRIRQDFSIANGINVWVVADNLRKGAATNAVQIAEMLLK
jgi:aspartate-semialdehyde dehydrogenase